MCRSVTSVLVALSLVPLAGAFQPQTFQRQTKSSPELVFTYDLRPLGLVTDRPGFFVYSSNDSLFLSNDLVLVSLNRREYSKSFDAQSTTPGERAESPTVLLLFSLSQKKLVGTVTRQPAKFPGSILGLVAERWIVVGSTGVQLCSESTCTPASAADGVLPLPRNGQWSATSQDRWSAPAQFLFLNDERMVKLEGSAAVVMTLDRTPVYQISVRDVYRNTSFVPCASGSRFLINEFAYTRVNSIVNLWDGETSRPRNLKRVRLIDVSSGKTLFEKHWDPHRPDDSDDMPALSPDGHRVALVKQGILEVYEIN